MPTAQEFVAAIQNGKVKEAEAMLGADHALAEARDANGISALMLARYRMNQPLVDAIASHRKDLDLFEAAALGRDRELADCLKRSGDLARSYAADGFTALHLACFFGHEAAARLLVDAGADPNAIAKNPSQVTPLHSAAAGRAVGCVRLLLADGSAPDVRQQGGFTPLMSAANNGDSATAKALLEKGARREPRSDDGKTAADIAREKGFAELAELLRP